MRFLKYLAYGLIGILLLAVLGFALAWVLSAPEPLPEGSEANARLAHGPYEVARTELVWTDTSRPTQENGDFPGAPERTLATSLWLPKDAEGPYPLILYAHGFLSNRNGGQYLAEHLASHGYVVAAPDFPLTHGTAPGGANYKDVVHQPADISFLIDTMLGLDESERPFAGTIDPNRIGVMGVSLGGATVTLAAFHPEWRDERIAAAISMAGPGDVFGPGFYDTASVPYLMIASTADWIVDYELNALPVVEHARSGGLLTVVNGSHSGYDQSTTGWIRIFGNPDGVGCYLFFSGVEPGDGHEDNAFIGMFGTQEQGLIVPEAYQAPCTKEITDVMRAGHQQMIVTVAVHAFFESHLAPDPQTRRDNETFLKQTLPAELDEVTYTESRRQ